MSLGRCFAVSEPIASIDAAWLGCTNAGNVINLSQTRAAALCEHLQVFDKDHFGGAVKFKVDGLLDDANKAGEVRYTVRFRWSCCSFSICCHDRHCWLDICVDRHARRCGGLSDLDCALRRDSRHSSRQAYNTWETGFTNATGSCNK